jgi:hypothetical protein
MGGTISVYPRYPRPRRLFGSDPLPTTRKTLDTRQQRPYWRSSWRAAATRKEKTSGTLGAKRECRRVKLANGSTSIDCNYISEFPTTRSGDSWVPPHACPYTVDDVEFYSLKLIQHHCDVDCTFGGRPELWTLAPHRAQWTGPARYR